MRDPLNPLEHQVYLYLIDYLSEHTYQPSIREIARHFGIRSTRTAATVLKSLERKGYLQRDASRSRAVQLMDVPAPTRIIPVPLYLRVEATQPILRDENGNGFVAFDRRFVPNADVFAVLTSRTMSAPAAGVMPGDCILVDPSSPSRTGALVLARVGDEMVVRTLERKGSRTLLLSGDASVAELQLGPASDFEIVGVVCGVFRSIMPMLPHTPED